MPCVDPFTATKSAVTGKVSMGVSLSRFFRAHGESYGDWMLSASSLLLPCGACVGCQISRAREWAIRCSLEEQLSPVCSFVTLTYSDRYVPPTLSRKDVSLFFRYLRRKAGRLRFFACGEYGERFGRPHYHALLFGPASREAAEEAWGRKGFVTMEPVTPARISYTAGYCAKKLGFHRPRGEEIDYSTGEVYLHQPPFLQMSRRPGIGGEFRRHWRSWRRSAIWQGREFPVPRFLHQSYRESASESELAKLELEKFEARMRPTVRELDASRDIARSRMELRSQRAEL